MEILLSFVTVFVASGVGWLTVKATRKKMEAEALQSDATAAGAVSEAAIALIAPLSQRIEDLEREVRSLRAALEEKNNVETELTEQLTLARARILHLEDVCKRAGINGEGEDNE